MMFVSKQAHFMRILLTGIIAVRLQFVTCGTVQKKLVFEAFSYGDDTSYDLYMGNQVSSQNGGNRTHFKDPLVNMWGNQILVHKVTIAIMKNSSEQAFVVFNGTGTSKTSWMKQERILNSSYTDIKTEEANYFNVEGDVLTQQKGRRMFFMNKSYAGCDKDAGWIQVLVGTGFCPWEITKSKMTLVSFIPGSAADVWENNVQTADSMRIFVEYEVPGPSTTSSSSSSTSSSSSSSTTSSSSSSTTSSSSLSSEKMTTEVLSTLSVEASTEKTATATTTLVKGSSTTTTASLSSSSEKVITKVPATASVESSTSTEKGTAASTTTLVQDFTCPPCAPCESNVQVVKNMTLNELTEAVQQLKSQLRVDKTKLSSSIRRRTSAVDKRPSATAVGGVIGGVITAVIFGAIVLPDIVTLCRYIFFTLRRC